MRLAHRPAHNLKLLSIRKRKNENTKALHIVMGEGIED